MIDIIQLKKKLETAREKYKPERIKYLLVAEAPPDGIDRFFYYTDVFKHDDLFLGVSRLLYPVLKEEHLKSRRRNDGSVKQLILNKFKEDGFYLIDLSELPLSLLKESLDSQVPFLINKINKLRSEDTKIILIKANVYDSAFTALTNAGINNIINSRITFPGSGGQTKFHHEFAEALKKAKHQ